MNASFSGFLRTLVMLTCLVAVPALALFGAPVSKLFRPLIEADWPGRAQELLSQLQSKLPETAAADDGKPTPIVPMPEIDPAPEPLAPATIADAGSPPANSPESSPIPYFPPSAMPSPHEARATAPPERIAEPLIRPAGHVTPAPSAAMSSDPFQAMQLRLRELGATYYKLETWGPDGQMYRFHCRMAVDSRGIAARHFEATADDPLVAMQRLLAEVEPWVAAGRR